MNLHLTRFLRSFAQPSIRSLTTAGLIVFSLSTLVLAYFVQTQLEAAALKANTASIRRVLEVSVNENMRQMHARMFELGTQIQSHPRYREALDNIHDVNEFDEVRNVLNEPLVNGFPGIAYLDVIKLRLYDLDLRLRVESSADGIDMTAHLPVAMLQTARTRSGVDRIRSLSALWQGPVAPLYSVLLPLGGLNPVGYLEIIADPVFNLVHIDKMTDMPVQIQDAQGNPLNVANHATDKKQMLPIEYILPLSEGGVAFRIIGQQNLAAFHEDIQQTWRTTAVIVAGLTFLMFGLGIWLLNRLLFQPFAQMRHEMEECAKGNLSVHVQPRGLLDVKVLADAFNAMASQLREHVAAIERNSNLDSLTGLANRRQLDRSLNTAWRRAAREKQMLSLLMMDIDFFKKYNDTYGHLVGDDCLRQVALAIRKGSARPDDLAARYGGEEFVVLLSDTDEAGAQKVADRITEALFEMAIAHAGSIVSPYVTMSIGICSCQPAFEKDPEILISRADQALYAAKRAGRNRHALFSRLPPSDLSV